MRIFNVILNKKQTNKQVNSNFPWSVLLSTIDLEMTSKCSKLSVEPLADITSRSRFFEKLQLKWTSKLSMLLWKNKNKTNKSTAIFHGLYSYRPQKEITSKCSKLCGRTTSRHIIWESYLSLLSCVARLCFGRPDRVGLCLGNLFWEKKTIKHVSKDTFSDKASNGKGKKTAIASPKVS